MVSNITRIVQKEIAKNRKEGLREGIQEGLEEGRQEGRQIGLEMGRQEGLEAGRQEGLDQARRAIARKMVQDGIPETKIADLTELPVEAIRAIALDIKP